MSLALFRFKVDNLSTKETTEFLGQGDTLEEAFKDGVKNCRTQFRGKNDGKARDELGMMVQTAQGVKHRPLPEFESDKPYSDEEPDFS